ncbi:MAG TPA: response regulator transcription factor [Armatimonadota bacterium]
MPATILLIEDDQQIRDLLPRYLQKEGMSTLAAADGRTGLQIVAERNVDLILLDVNLPDIDGWSILRRLRGSASSQPAVIMLTGRSDVPDRLLGLDLGADDYIIKPFEPLEVVARVKAVLRRLRGHKETEELEFPGLRISLIGRAAWRQERALNLSMKEFDLLVALASNPGRVMTRF